MLEKQIVPLFYKRGVDNIPREWIARMKNCMRKLAPVFNTNRMVQRLRREVLHPRAATAATQLAADGLARVGRAGAREGRAAAASGAASRSSASTPAATATSRSATRMQVEALVDLPDVDPKDVHVQLYAGPINATGEIERPHVMDLTYGKPMAPGRHLFIGKIDCRTSGRQGFAIRIVPGHPDMATPFEPGLITWN